MVGSWILRWAACVLLSASTLALAAERGYFGFAVTVDIDSMSLDPTLRTVKVDQVVAGSPAAKAGLMPGDFITEVQGLVVAGAKGNELKVAMQKLVGEALRLKIRHRNTGPVEVSMTADRDK